MNFLEIKEMAKKNLSIDEFLHSNEKEIIAYIQAIKDGKDTIIIYSDNDDSLSREELLNILSYYLEGHLLEWDIEYIMRILDMTEIQTEDSISKIAYYFSDPYLGFSINTKNIENAINLLNGGINVHFEKANKNSLKIKNLRINYRSKVQEK